MLAKSRVPCMPRCGPTASRSSLATPICGARGSRPTGRVGSWLSCRARPGCRCRIIQLVFNAGSMTAHPYFPPFVPPYADSFSCRAVLLRPESRGQIELASSDPRIPVRIRLNFLATEKDWATLRAGVRLAREIGRQPALASLSAGEIAPGPDCQSDAELDAHIRATAITFHHPLGTCKMGRSNDPDAVVDPEPGCWVSTHCGSSTLRSCRTWSATTSTHQSL